MVGSVQAGGSGGLRSVRGVTSAAGGVVGGSGLGGLVGGIGSDGSGEEDPGDPGGGGGIGEEIDLFVRMYVPPVGYYPPPEFDPALQYIQFAVSGVWQGADGAADPDPPSEFSDGFDLFVRTYAPVVGMFAPPILDPADPFTLFAVSGVWRGDLAP